MLTWIFSSGVTIFDWIKAIKKTKLEKEEVEEVEVESKDDSNSGLVDYKSLLHNFLKEKGGKNETDECGLIARLTGKPCIKFPPTNNVAAKVFDKIKNL